MNNIDKFERHLDVLNEVLNSDNDSDANEDELPEFKPRLEYGPWAENCSIQLSMKNLREGRRGDGHIGQGWVLRFKAKSNTDLQHHIQKRYTYAIDSDVNIYRQLEHKLNCFGKQHYHAQALNF
ncbi:hypothetical protein OUZ56_030023 [Daphnia magna]|uniref:Uncharacterized protein n=1 Tax=Daphnia magna TaxID=35525 RepID=A0ABR0B8H6_9CRUS|nr:hypothetical protein OUZ56_030023 [Daphnia magna]